MKTLSLGRGGGTCLGHTAGWWQILVSVSLGGLGHCGAEANGLPDMVVSLVMSSCFLPGHLLVPEPGKVLGQRQKQPWSSPGYCTPKGHLGTYSRLHPQLLHYSQASVFPPAECVSCSSFLWSLLALT